VQSTRESCTSVNGVRSIHLAVRVHMPWASARQRIRAALCRVLVCVCLLAREDSVCRVTQAVAAAR